MILSLQRSAYQVQPYLFRENFIYSFTLAIDISLARDSHKTVGSIQLGTNNFGPLRDIHKTMHAGEAHREEFDPPM